MLQSITQSIAAIDLAGMILLVESMGEYHGFQEQWKLWQSGE